MALEAAGFEVETEIIRGHRTTVEVEAGTSLANALGVVSILPVATEITTRHAVSLTLSSPRLQRLTLLPAAS
jgi:hypothetical protein